MPNHLLIYVIVALNAACHPMLIYRLKLASRAKWYFSALAVAIPAATMLFMRVVVAIGGLHTRVAEQGGFERAITTGGSLLLIVGPMIATGAAIVFSRKHRSLVAQHC